MTGTGTGDFRVTQDDVEEVISVRLEDDVWPFVRMAHALTDWVQDQDSSSLLNSELLYHIELNLACHFYTMWRQLYKSEKIGDASATYQGQTEMYLESSRYGQTAMLMDVTGKLAERNRKAKDQPKTPSIFWAGKSYDSPRPDGKALGDIP